MEFVPLAPRFLPRAGLLRTTSSLCVPALLLLIWTATPSAARERGQAVGSAIAPRVSVTPTAVAPASDVHLVACLTNGQPAASRPLQAGDELMLTLAAGSVGSCDLLPSETGFGDAPDWQCSVSGNDVQVQYRGAARTWPAGDVVCVSVGWRSSDRPTAMVFTAAPAIAGSMAPPEPAAVPLAVAPSDGLSRPAGSVRQVVQATSTRGVRASAGDPPQVVPGAEAELDLDEGSRVLVIADGVAHDTCGSATPPQRGNGVLLVDGAVASTRRLEMGSLSGTGATVWPNFAWTWLSPPLPAGLHRVELAVVVDEWASAGVTACVGHATDPDLKASLTILEMSGAR